MSRRAFTLIFPYYRNPGMLLEQYRQIAALPDEVRASLHVVIVDDGSPKDPAEPPLERFTASDDGSFRSKLDDETELAFHARRRLGIASFQLFRVEVDVRWNWLTCRNIAAHHARTDWLLMTDIDHTVPEVTARRIQEKKLDPAKSYRFSRVDAPKMTEYKPHPNSWLFTGDRFDRIGGYDERFSGFYGTDGEFRDRVRLHSKEIVMLPEPLVRWPREVVADASTTSYGRKEKQDHEGVTKIRSIIARDGGEPLRRSFPYHQVV